VLSCRCRASLNRPKNCTTPVGVPLPEAATTVAVKVTLCRTPTCPDDVGVVRVDFNASE